MKKFIIIISALLTVISCSKFPHQGTATESLAGRWMVTAYYSDGEKWTPCGNTLLSTYNTAANIPTEMWFMEDDFWGSHFKIDCNAETATFGRYDKQYDDNGAGTSLQKVYDGKVTVNAATAPVSKSLVDKIECFIEYSDDDPEAFCTVYYLVGYRYTGFPEDDDQFVANWPSMPEAKLPLTDK